jgi:hypothetical protein
MGGGRGARERERERERESERGETDETLGQLARRDVEMKGRGEP